MQGVISQLQAKGCAVTTVFSEAEAHAFRVTVAGADGQTIIDVPDMQKNSSYSSLAANQAKVVAAVSAALGL